MNIKFTLSLLLLFVSQVAPGQSQWKQNCDYTIEVRLDDSLHILRGFERFVYKNNSPDTLKYIYIHLWPNAYKNDRTPFAKQQELNRSTAFYYSQAEQRGYIDSLNFSVNNEERLILINDETPDIAKLELKKALLPGEQIEVSTPFKVKIPLVFSRLGHTGQSYFISQWYPKPAVYDALGWHPISYLDQGEFYSEYGSFDVRISLPKNYTVMATGNCMNAEENARMDSLALVPAEEPKGKKSAKPAPVVKSDKQFKTLQFKEDHVHDFAWFASKNWIIRKDTAHVAGNNNTISVWCAFLPQHLNYWKKGNAYLKETLHSYGDEVGPYPYKTIKAVEGDMHAGGGMEYPTVTIIDKAASSSLHSVLVHEAGHNWFYGILGSMERDHAWMDEGINTFYEQKTTGRSTLDSGKKKKFNDYATLALLQEHQRTKDDQAIEQGAAAFTLINYGLDVYYKTALSMAWLEKYMGANDFKYAMQDYYKQWQYRHPYPEDLHKILNKHSAKKVDWFFNEALTTKNKIDFAIGHVSHQNEGSTIVVKNKGHQMIPVIVDVYRNDSVVETLISEPFKDKTTLKTSPGLDWDKVKIDAAIPDCKTANNTQSSGIKIKLLGGLNREEKELVFLDPAIGYNSSDGIMAGLILHNLTLPENRFKFVVMPLYSSRGKDLVGGATLGYSWYPNTLFKEILLQTDVKSYHLGDRDNINLQEGYRKIAPALHFTFKEKEVHSAKIKELSLKYYQISEDNLLATLGRDILQTQNNNYSLINYTFTDRRAFNPYNYQIELHGNGSFQKLSLSSELRIDYNKPGKALYVRGYFGKFFSNSSNPLQVQRYYLNAGYSGVNDYLYDGTYSGRYDAGGLFAQQISIQEGGFKIPVHAMAVSSSDWLGSVNLMSDLPIKYLPIRLFLDIGLIPNPSPSLNDPNSTHFIYDGGVEIVLIKNLASVYVPILMSGDFRDYLSGAYGSKHVFTRSISFSIKMQQLNILKATTLLNRLIGG